MTEEDSRSRGRQIGLIVVGLILLVILVVIGLWVFLGPSTTDERGVFIQAVGGLLAALAGIAGVYFTWKNTGETRQSAQSPPSWSEEAQRAQLLVEEAQVSNRFALAIDQLGATDDDGRPRLEVRLGGIYGLERIAKDSPKDSTTVMEVLTAYVRENAPRQPEEISKPTSASETPPRPRADIQAILDVLGRREQDSILEDYRVIPEALQVSINLDKTNLQGAVFRGANLRAASFRGANLQEANLQKANLREASFQGANLQEANFREANLSRACLNDVDLSTTDLRMANLAGAALQRTKIRGGSLKQADLSEADLRGADLRGVDLKGTNLSGADLPWASLQNTAITKEQLANCASLTGAIMPDGSRHE